MSEKKSWRERDRGKDQSAHRKDESPRGKQPRVETATAAYKRTLDAFFDRGVVPEGLKDKLPSGAGTADGEGNARQKWVRALRDATTAKALEKAVDGLIAESGVPDDMELLLRFLEHSNDAVLLQALVQIEAFMATGKPVPKKGLFVEKLKGLEFSSFDPRVQMKSQRIVGQMT